MRLTENWLLQRLMENVQMQVELFEIPLVEDPALGAGRELAKLGTRPLWGWD